MTVSSYFLPFILGAGFGISAQAQSTSEVIQGEPQSSQVSQVKSTTTNTQINVDPDPIQPPSGMVPSCLLKLGNGLAFSNHAFVADKSRRTLTIWKKVNGNIELVGAHPIDYGKKQGNKQVSGDLRTPEGVYVFQKQLSGASLNFDEYGSFAYTMNYPNHFDQMERKTGHGIWLHGIPNSKTLKRGSRGCVVVRNKIINELGQFIDLAKTPIIVSDKVDYLTPDSSQEQSQKLQRWLDGWVNSWQSKDIDQYMSYYGDDFKSNQFNKRTWRKYKSTLNQKYQYIKVVAKNPVILKHKDQVVIQFIQDYQSDKLSDFGEKNLYLKMSPDGQYKIVGEQWKAFAPDLLAQLQPEKSATKEN